LLGGPRVVILAVGQVQDALSGVVPVANEAVAMRQRLARLRIGEGDTYLSADCAGSPGAPHFRDSERLSE